VSKYHDMPDHDILVGVAIATEEHSKHLKHINGSIANQERRIMRMEIQREVEEKMGYTPLSKKRRAAEGSMYGGVGALFVSALFAAGNLLGWW